MNAAWCTIWNVTRHNATRSRKTPRGWFGGRGVGVGVDENNSLFFSANNTIPCAPYIRAILFACAPDTVFIVTGYHGYVIMSYPVYLPPTSVAFVARRYYAVYYTLLGGCHRVSSERHDETIIIRRQYTITAVPACARWRPGTKRLEVPSNLRPCISLNVCVKSAFDGRATGHSENVGIVLEFLWKVKHLWTVVVVTISLKQRLRFPWIILYTSSHFATSLLFVSQ